ncbi:MAG: HNH endonuclease [Chloroflexi bacterium]|nr:HNH endonuclease [Chloroflexota bacterium]MCH9010009.1 HNH endonuclease [Chloroflexota bacterium]
MNSPVLVLNQNYQPLNVCNVRRAVVLLGRGKAEIIINGRGHIRTISLLVQVPSVIRLVYMVRRPLVRRRLSRRAIFYRDGFRCQYCGKESKNMTLDHIMPRSRGGPHVWENVVSACIPCNHKKAGLTPKEANMRMLKKPTAPRPNPYYMFHHRSILEEWRQFMPWME